MNVRLLSAFISAITVTFINVAILKRRITVFYSSEVWCKAYGSEVTCGGSGALTHEVVHSCGAYSYFTRAVVLDGITSLGVQCFAWCSRLKEVEVASLFTR